MKIYLRLKNFGEKLFTRHLLLTNTTLGVLFMGAGDTIQQTIERKMILNKSYEKNRTRNMMTVGCGFGLIAHAWYKMLDSKFPGKKAFTILKKLAAESAVGPPLVLAFFVSMGLLEGKPVQLSFKEFKQNFVLICLADWAVYLPLQAVNFYFLPPRYRVLYVCTLTLFYDVFLSYILHKEDNERLKEKEKL